MRLVFLLFIVLLDVQGFAQIIRKPPTQPATAQPAGGANRRANARPFGNLTRPNARADTLPRPRLDSTARADSVRLDSLTSRQSSLREEVVASAEDSSTTSTDQKIMELFGQAKVDYGDINLQADYIRLNWETNEVFATGTKDTLTGKTRGDPIFKQGSETYNTTEIRYNFKTKRAIIRGIVTQQGDGNIRGNSVKKDSLDNMYLRRAFYTTCNLLHPHFGISAPRIKLVQGKGDNKQVISGPFNLVIAGIPLPLGLPFGFFPFSESRRSGLIVPSYGEEPNNRGFYLRDGGYYWAASENIGVRFLGQIYSRGGWGLGSQANYTKRYRYSGNFFLQFNRNRTGEEIGPNRKISNDFRIQWAHSPVSRGGQSFSASVDISSQNYNQNNEYNPQRYLSNAFGSSVQYSRNFGQAVQSSANLRFNQNIRTNVLTATAGFNVGVNQIQPFKRKSAVTPAWYESFRLGMSLTGSADLTNDLRPQISGSSLPEVIIVNLGSGTAVRPRPDSLPPTAAQQLALLNQSQESQRIGVKLTAENIQRILKNAQVRSSFSVPITLPNFKIARYINLTPSVSLQGDLLTKRLSYAYVQNNRFADSSGIRIDTTAGLFPAFNYSFAMSMNTRVYGTFYIRKGRFEAIRHTFAPSISFNYTPDFSQNKSLYTQVQINNRKETRYLSNFINYSSGSIGRVLGTSFSLTNQLEMKMRAKSDTAKEQFTKISIFDNFGLNGSYNFVADSFNLSNLSFNANTQILKKYNISFSSNFDPYNYVPDRAYGTIGRRTSQYLFSSGGGLARLQNMNASISTSFKSGGGAKAKQPVQQNQPPPNPNTEAQLQFINRNPDLYVDWNVPWSLQVNYQFSYLRNGLAPSQTIQTLNFSGDLSLTANDKWKLSIQSGWDFVAKGPSLTNVSLMRDLHCWEAAFNWTPISGQAARVSNYSFELRVKSALLRDLKLSRRRSFYDYGGGF